MPRRRRKYRPPQQELEKAVPFFVKASHQEVNYDMVQSKAALTHNKQAAIDQAKEQVAQLLHAAKCAIKNSQPESAAIHQRRAVELYNMMIEADVSEVDLIQADLHRFCTCLEESVFSCGSSIICAYGQQKRVINLGYSFPKLGKAAQIKSLLKAVIQSSGLAARHQLPVGHHENTDPAEAWVKYIFTLLDLLPDQPYLTVDTPVNYSVTLDKDAEIEEEDEEDTEAEEPATEDSENETNIASSRSPEDGDTTTEETNEQEEEISSEETPNNFIGRVRNFFSRGN